MCTAMPLDGYGNRSSLLPENTCSQSKLPIAQRPSNHTFEFSLLPPTGQQLLLPAFRFSSNGFTNQCLGGKISASNSSDYTSLKDFGLFVAEGHTPHQSENQSVTRPRVSVRSVHACTLKLGDWNPFIDVRGGGGGNSAPTTPSDQTPHEHPCTPNSDAGTPPAQVPATDAVEVVSSSTFQSQSLSFYSGSLITTSHSIHNAAGTKFRGGTASSQRTADDGGPDSASGTSKAIGMSFPDVECNQELDEVRMTEGRSDGSQSHRVNALALLPPPAGDHGVPFAELLNGFGTHLVGHIGARLPGKESARGRGRGPGGVPKGRGVGVRLPEGGLGAAKGWRTRRKQLSHALLRGLWRWRENMQIRKKRRKNLGEYISSGAASGRSGELVRGHLDSRPLSASASYASYGHHSDLPWNGTSSSGELYYSSGGASKAAERARIGVDGYASGGSAGIDVQEDWLHRWAMSEVQSESGYGSELGYGGDGEFGDCDEGDEEERRVEVGEESNRPYLSALRRCGNTGVATPLRPPRPLGGRAQRVGKGVKGHDEVLIWEEMMASFSRSEGIRMETVGEEPAGSPLTSGERKGMEELEQTMGGASHGKFRRSQQRTRRRRRQLADHTSLPVDNRSSPGASISHKGRRHSGEQDWVNGLQIGGLGGVRLGGPLGWGGACSGYEEEEEGGEAESGGEDLDIGAEEDSDRIDAGKVTTAVAQASVRMEVEISFD